MSYLRPENTWTTVNFLNFRGRMKWLEAIGRKHVYELRSPPIKSDCKGGFQIELHPVGTGGRYTIHSSWVCENFVSLSKIKSYLQSTVHSLLGTYNLDNSCQLVRWLVEGIFGKYVMMAQKSYYIYSSEVFKMVKNVPQNWKSVL